MSASALISLARPYARALFQVSNTPELRASTAAFLGILADIIADPRIQARLNDPKLDAADWVSWLSGFFARQLTVQEQTFLTLLVQKKRLPTLPAIAQLFERMRAESEKRLSVEIQSQTPLSTADQERLVAKLTTRFGRRIDATYVQKDIMGGVIIRVGDWVLDGSIKNRLAQLSEDLMRC